MNFIKYVMAFLALISPILIILVINYRSRLSELSKYTIFLEDEYYHFINMLDSLSDEEKDVLIKKAKITSLYKKIEDDNSDGLNKFEKMFYPKK